jgi:hypothetical protein
MYVARYNLVQTFTHKAASLKNNAFDSSSPFCLDIIERLLSFASFITGRGEERKRN